MNVLVILKGPAYGTEASYNGLRLADNLAKRDGVNAGSAGAYVSCTSWIISGLRDVRASYGFSHGLARVDRDGPTVAG